MNYRIPSLLIICMATVSVCAHAKKPAVYTVSGDSVEVYSGHSTWKSVRRGKTVKSDDYIRASGDFSLTDKNDFSRPYGKCDCTLVSKLNPLKMVRVSTYGNDVITRKAAYADVVSAAERKEAAKMAGDCAGEGWMPAQGGKPLKDQFTDLVLRQRTTQEGQPVFLLGTGVVSGGSYAEARRAALLRARVNIVAQMESEVRSLVEIASERGSLSGQEASEALSAVSSSKVTVRERLGNTEEVVGIYRDTPTGVEVRITLAYSFDQACDDLKNAASESVAIQKLLNEKH